jgi:hypothetical protein
MAMRALLVALGVVSAYRIGTEQLAALDVALQSNIELAATESRKCGSSQATYEKMKLKLEKKIGKGRSVTEPTMLVHAIRAARNLKVGHKKECAWVAEHGTGNSTPTMTGYLDQELAKTPCAKQGREFLDKGDFILAFYAFLADEGTDCDSVEEQVSYLREAKLNASALEDIDDDATELEVELATEASEGDGSALLDLGSGELISRGLLIVIIILAILFAPITVTILFWYFIITAILCLVRKGSWEGCMNYYWSF